MTTIYEAEREHLGRRPVTLVDFDLDRCTLTFGVSPCAATLRERRARTAFGDDTLGAIPDGWTLQGSATAAEFAIEDVSGAEEGRLLRGTPTGSGRRVISWDRTAGYADVERTIRARSTSASGRQIEIVLRGTGAGATSAGYILALVDGDTLELGRIVAGSYTVLEQAAFAWSADTWYRVRFRLNGTTLQGRAWEDGEAEPTAWMVEQTDATITAGGFNGVGWAAETGTKEFDWILDRYVDPSSKCFNTRVTCLDPANYAPEPYRRRFVEPDSGISPEVGAIPSLMGAPSVAPTRIDPSRGLGMRADVRIQFQDHPHDDVGEDDYLADRDYAPFEQGTYWGKLIARNPYYQGRPLRVQSGYITAEEGEGEPWSDGTGFTDGTWWTAAGVALGLLISSRFYILERIEGPDRRGIVTITAKDPLKILDDDRAQLPLPSRGRLVEDIEEGATSFVLTPETIGEEYPAAGLVRIGREIIAYATRTGDTLAGLTRGAENTEVSSHGSGDTVQVCVEYAGNIIDVLRAVMVDAGFPAAFIPVGEWATERDRWFKGYNVRAVLAEPTGMTKLITEIVEIGNFALWWDERLQRVNIRGTFPPRPDQVRPISDRDHLLRGVTAAKDDPSRRISRVRVSFGQIDPTIRLDEPTNYRGAVIYVNAEAEHNYGEARIHDIWSRWLTVAGRAHAVALAARLARRYQDNPRMVTFDLDAKDSDVWTGDIVDLSTWQIQDAFGEPSGGARMQIIETKEMKPGDRYQYMAMSYPITGRFLFIAPNDAPSYAAASEEQRELFGYIAGTGPGGAHLDGAEPHRII